MGISTVAVHSTADADAIHPGVGFLSENARFAEVVAEHNITFIGPSPDHMRIMGDKVTAKQTVAGLNLPVIRGSDGAVSGVDEAQAVAKEIGFPVLIKAASGGGGKGMKVARSADELGEAL